MLHTCGQCERAHDAAVGKSPLPYRFQPFWQGDRLHRIATIEGKVGYAGHRRWHGIAAPRCVFTAECHKCLSIFGEQYAVDVAIVGIFGVNGYRFQLGTTLKGSFANVGHIFADFHYFQRCATEKRLFANTGHGFGNHNIHNP